MRPAYAQNAPAASQSAQAGAQSAQSPSQGAQEALGLCALALAGAPWPGLCALQPPVRSGPLRWPVHHSAF